MTSTRAPSRRKPASLNVVDTLSIFGAVEALKDSREKPVVFSYRELLTLTEQTRKQFGLRPADATVAAVALDPSSEPQRRFVDAISNMGISVEEVDYRDSYVSLPGGYVERQERPVSSLSPSLAYLIGLVAERSDKPQVVVVSGSFDLYGPLLDFVNTRGGDAVLCFFKSFLDKRWTHRAGVLNSDSPIRFVDLDPHGQALVGMDLSGSRSAVGRSKGLASI
jgi:hypothetical protein